MIGMYLWYLGDAQLELFVGFKSYLRLASYPGRVGGERRPGIDCLRMRGRFRYISVKL